MKGDSNTPKNGAFGSHMQKLWRLKKISSRCFKIIFFEDKYTFIDL